MDYEVGSIADLISGNHTPNRQKVSKKPLTPVKIPPAANVTPRESTKKTRTPKIAFTPEVQDKGSAKQKSASKLHTDSPKTENAKKRKSKLINNFQFLSQLPDHSESGKEDGSDASQDNEKLKKKKSFGDRDPKTIIKEYFVGKTGEIEEPPSDKKKKTKRSSISDVAAEPEDSSPKKKKKTNKQSLDELAANLDDSTSVNGVNEKKRKVSESGEPQLDKLSKKERKQLKKQMKLQKSSEETNEAEIEEGNMEVNEDCDNQASDDEVDEDNLTDFQKAAAKRVKQKLQRSEKFNEDEIERTIFVGNIPVSVLKQNHEKVLKGIFSRHGAIDTIRIRNIPVVDFKTKPKVALIEKNFHPQRTTVIAYVKFVNSSSVEKALEENNTILDENHIRVDRCYKEKVPVDSRKTCFLGNLPFNVEEESLRGIFEKCGEIKSIRVVRDRQTQIGKGIGFINFEKADGVEFAVNMAEEDLTIGKKVIRVQRYNAPANNSNKPQRGKRNQGTRDGNNPRFGRFQKHDQSQNRNQKSYGNKRDEQGNKIRKRDKQPGNERKRKMSNNEGNENPSEKSNESQTEVAPMDPATIMEQNKLKRDKRNLDFKGLMALKKKKYKIDRGVMKKKKISKILLQKYSPALK